MYTEVVTRVTDDLFEIKKYHMGLYGAPGQRRKKKDKPTTTAVQNYNRKRRERHIQLLILANFMKGHHVILTYPESSVPSSYEEAEKNLADFLDRMRRELKSQGKEFCYIAVTERGKKKAVLHHHMIIQDIPGIKRLVSEMWGKTIGIVPRKNISGQMRLKLFGSGMDIKEIMDPVSYSGKFIKTFRIYEDGECSDLAAYIVKAETKEEQKGSRYHISRNLKKPEVIRKSIIPGRMNEPKAKEGFSVIERSILSGTNPVTGRPYQRYFVIKETDKKNCDMPDMIVTDKKRKRNHKCMDITGFLKLKKPSVHDEHWDRDISDFEKSDKTGILGKVDSARSCLTLGLRNFGEKIIKALKRKS